MSVRFPSVGSSSQTFITCTTTSETIISTTPPIALPIDNAQIYLLWYFKLVLGTGCTSITIAIRRGAGITGTIINNGFADQGGITAGLEITRAGCYTDTPGVAAGQQYSLTIQCNAATGNSIIHDATFLALVL